MLSRLFNHDPFNSKLGVCHFDEVVMLFKPFVIPISTVFTEEDEIVSRSLVQMWTDFVVHGDPTPKESQGMWIR